MGEGGDTVSVHWGMGICSVMDSLRFEVYENYHGGAIQQYLSNFRGEMSTGAWGLHVCNSRESRVGEGFGGLYRN